MWLPSQSINMSPSVSKHKWLLLPLEIWKPKLNSPYIPAHRNTGMVHEWVFKYNWLQWKSASLDAWHLHSNYPQVWDWIKDSNCIVCQKWDALHSSIWGTPWKSVFGCFFFNLWGLSSSLLQSSETYKALKPIKPISSRPKSYFPS